jgi:predicted nucleic acid-binding protein
MTPVEIRFRYRPQLRDPDDELVLEAALNGGADAIVTHNVRDFLPESVLFGVAVWTPGRIIEERFHP